MKVTLLMSALLAYLMFCSHIMADHSKLTATIHLYELIHKIVPIYWSALHKFETWFKHNCKECSTSMCDYNYDALRPSSQNVRTPHTLKPEIGIREVA